MEKKGKAPWARRLSYHDFTHLVRWLYFFTFASSPVPFESFFYQTYSQLEVAILAREREKKNAALL